MVISTPNGAQIGVIQLRIKYKINILINDMQWVMQV